VARGAARAADAGRARDGDRRPRVRAAGGDSARAGRVVAAVPVDADVRPVGMDPVGPRDRAPRPADDRRAVVEAVPGDLHDGLLAVRRGGSGPVAGRRARRRPAGGAARVPACLAVDGRWRRRGCDGRRRRRRRADHQLAVRAHDGARQLRGADGRVHAVGDRAPSRRQVPAGVRAGLPGLAAATGDLAVPRRLRAVAGADRSRCGSFPSTGARATSTAPPTARSSPTPTAPRSPSTRSPR
jgi:hypothetical protein